MKTEAEQKAFIALKQLYETVTIAYYSGVSYPLLWRIKFELENLEKAYVPLSQEANILSNAAESPCPCDKSKVIDIPHRHSIREMSFERFWLD